MLRDYVYIARPDHWFKNVFMLPGMVLAWLAAPPAEPLTTLGWMLWSLVATCLICSSNYTINEWLDAAYDRLHPEKKDRPAASGRIKAPLAYAQWAGLAALGLAMSWAVGLEFFLAQATLFVMAIIYNVPPLRAKEKAVLDVLTESVNNPLRLLLGWYAVGVALVPPVSLLMSYWMLGAFLMAVKRLGEYRHIADPARAASYRSSFGFYNQERLITSIIFYATAFALFAGIFLAKYRLELILTVPFYAGFMGYYMHLGFMHDSPAMNPERLYRQRGFFAYMVLTVAVTLLCLVADIPILYKIFETTVPQGF